MKKLLLAALSAAFFMSCSDDDSASVNMNELTKKWYPVKIVYDGEEYPYSHDSCANDYLEFFEDNTTVFVEYYECTPYTDEGTYTVNGNTITRVEDDGDAITVTVTKLTASELVVKGIDDSEGTPYEFEQTYSNTPQ